MTTKQISIGGEVDMNNCDMKCHICDNPVIGNTSNNFHFKCMEGHSYFFAENGKWYREADVFTSTQTVIESMKKTLEKEMAVRSLEHDIASEQGCESTFEGFDN